MRRKNGRKQGKRRHPDLEAQRRVAQEHAEKEAELLQRRREEEEARLRREDEVQSELHKLRIRHEAKKQLTAEITRQRKMELPEPGWTARDFIAEDDKPPEEVVDGLHFRGGNTLLVAEFKTGKTTLELNLAASLADGEPFLGKFATNLPYGKIAMFNYEMDERQFRDWLRRYGIKDIDRVLPLNLRGWQLPFWDEETMLELAEWLFTNEVGFLIIDPAAKAWRGLVEHEGDNVQLSEFFGALDELKRLADISNLLIAAHTPRGSEGRARGGGEVEAWPDANWYLTKDKDGVRSLRAEGRDVDLPKTDLNWDEEKKRLTAGVETEERTLTTMTEQAVKIVKSEGEIEGSSNLATRMKGPNNLKRKAIDQAVEGGLISMRIEGRKKVFS